MNGASLGGRCRLALISAPLFRCHDHVVQNLTILTLAIPSPRPCTQKRFGTSYDTVKHSWDMNCVMTWWPFVGIRGPPLGGSIPSTSFIRATSTWIGWGFPSFNNCIPGQPHPARVEILREDRGNMSNKCWNLPNNTATSPS